DNVPATRAEKLSWPGSIGGARCCGGMTWSRQPRCEGELQGRCACGQDLEQCARSATGEVVVAPVESLAHWATGIETPSAHTGGPTPPSTAGPRQRRARR